MIFAYRAIRRVVKMNVLLVHYKEWEKILVLSYMKTIDSAIFPERAVDRNRFFILIGGK